MSATEPTHSAAVPDTVLGMGKRRIVRLRAVMALAALVFATLVCLSMVTARSFYLGYRSNMFLVWNLALAWIPLGCAYATYQFYGNRRRRNLLFVLCAGAWFFFFPNAPYIVTDFVHLHHNPPIPLWFDLLTLASFAWTGLCLGYLSLYLMQEVVRARFGRWTSWIFVLVMLLLGSIGVYWGRFLRWNSWDVVHRPLMLLREALSLADDPLGKPAMAAFVCVLFLFLLLSYCATFALTHLHGETA